MSTQISGSVGRWERGAQNLADDVKTVQRLLGTAARALQIPELDPNGIDGKIAKPPARSNTVSAIEVFQNRIMSAVDGIISPESMTWGALMDVMEPAPQEPPTPAGPAVPMTDQGCLFPFPMLPERSWEERPRSFASPRGGGNRLHAGCDLYFPKGTPIHAIADGVVTRGPYLFYCETFALEVDHGLLLARYGEVQSATDVRAGDVVQAGQKIAKVGHLVGIQVPSDMLHLELYDKTRSGSLTVGGGSESAMRNGVSFMRRKDLMDPTSWLNQWQQNLPSA